MVRKRKKEGHGPLFRSSFAVVTIEEGEGRRRTMVLRIRRNLTLARGMPNLSEEARLGLGGRERTGPKMREKEIGGRERDWAGWKENVGHGPRLDKEMRGRPELVSWAVRPHLARFFFSCFLLSSIRSTPCTSCLFFQIFQILQNKQNTSKNLI